MHKQLNIDAPLHWPNHSPDAEEKFLSDLKAQFLAADIDPYESLYTGFFTENPDQIVQHQTQRQSTRAYTLGEWHGWLETGVTPLLYALSPNDEVGASCIAAYRADALGRRLTANGNVELPYYPKSGLLIDSLVAIVFVK